MSTPRKRRGIHDKSLIKSGVNIKQNFKNKYDENSEESKTDTSCDESDSMTKLKTPEDEKSLSLNQKYTNDSVSDKSCLYIGLVTIIMLISSVIYLKCNNNGSNFKDQIANCPGTITSCVFQQHYKNIEREFSNQNKLSWKVIRSAVNSVINVNEPKQPAVILFVSSKNADDVSSCLVNRLATSLEKSYGNLNGYNKINMTKGSTSLQMSKKIVETFKQSFEKHNQHVIVLERLDTFTAESAMMLHSYCDHENAPYKNIIIILTVSSNMMITEDDLSFKEMDRIARQRLNTVWEQQLNEDKRSALLSRITTSVALVLPEKNPMLFC